MDTINRFVFEHRRLLAAAFAGLTVLAALSALSSSPAGTSVVVASRDLPSGHVVSRSDVRLVAMPTDVVAHHSLTRTDTAVGRRVAGPMRAGEVVTDRRVLEPDVLSGYGADAVLTSVRIADAGSLTGIHAGDRVDVVAVDPEGQAEPTVIARRVTVATVPAAGDEQASLGVVTTEDAALALAAAALESRFSIITAAS